MVHIHSTDDAEEPVIKAPLGAKPPPTEEDRIRAAANELVRKAAVADGFDRRLARGYRERAAEKLAELGETAALVLNPSDNRTEHHVPADHR